VRQRRPGVKLRDGLFRFTETRGRSLPEETFPFDPQGSTPGELPALPALSFSCRSGMLFITLPSGRSLSYVKPRLGENRFGGESVTYLGVGTGRKWERIESYGPKFVENIVQGISRDLLCSAMRNLRDCDIVAHVHDELIIDAPPEMRVEDISARMSKTPAWAEGLLLRADGYECEFYQKS